MKPTAAPRKKTAAPRSRGKAATVAGRSGRARSPKAHTLTEQTRAAESTTVSPTVPKRGALKRSTGKAAKRSTGKAVKAPSAVAPKRSKKKRAKLARAELPHDCAILAIDAAENSGWSIWLRGVLQDFGECDVFGTGPAQFLARLMKLPGPHIVVVERPFMVKSGNSTGIGTADKIWRETAKRLGLERRTVRVYPSTWRAVTLPKGMANAKRDVVRPEELKAAKPIVSAVGLMLFDVMTDAAPAILIGQWASKAGEVLRVLPKPKPVKDTSVAGDSVKFGRFAIRSNARKRIERATDGAFGCIGTWLVVGGKSIQRTERIERATLESAQIRLGYLRMDDHGTGTADFRAHMFDAVTHVHIPYRATSEQIEAGWNAVADQVERDEAAAGRLPKPKRARKTKAAA